MILCKLTKIILLGNTSNVNRNTKKYYLKKWRKKIAYPDGFIPVAQCLVYYVILIVALYFSVKWAKSNLDEKRIPLLAVLAAGIFAIMSMNMPIPFGTSGHMVGGALVAIVFLAPEAAVLVFTVVLLIQALIFGDGGITALGANVLNMAIIGGAVGLYTFKGLNGTIGKYPAAGVAAWLATVIAALALLLKWALQEHSQ